MADAPESYKDPLYASLDAGTEAKLGLPLGLLQSIRTDGEKSNASQVSGAKAATVYQIIPATRDAILKQYGIDAYLSPENASKAAGLLLRDSLKRNDGDVESAVREYHGGTNRDNWGPVNDKYAERVMSGFSNRNMAALASNFSKWMKENPPTPAKPFANPGETIQTPVKLSVNPGETGQTPANPAGNPGETGSTPAKLDRLAADFSKWFDAPKMPDGSIAIPGTDPKWLAGKTPAQNQPEPSLGDQAIGAGEAALSTITGATTGALGAAGGLVAGIGKSVADGTFGTQQGVQMADQMAGQGAQAFTYAPRTQAGQNITSSIAEGAQQLAPLAGMTGELGALGKAVDPAAAAMRTGAAAVLDKAATGAPAKLAGIAEAPAAAQAPAVAAMAPEALAKTAKGAAEGGIGSAKATQTLAEQTAPNPETVKAAQRLGIADYLQPDHVTTNEAYRQIAGVVKSSSPMGKTAIAEREGLANVAKRASDLVDEIGGTTDVSNLDQSVKAKMLNTVGELEARADDLYKQLREKIPANTPAPADEVLSFIGKRAEDLGGSKNLSPMEQMVLRKLSPKTVKTGEVEATDPLMVGSSSPTKRQAVALQQPTYTLLDDVRKDVGAAARMAGPFKDADTGLAKKLYELLTNDQEKVANGAGMADVLQSAKQAVATRKGIEDDLSSLFGRNLDRSFVGGGQMGLPGAVSAASKGDASALIRLLQAVPEDMRQSVVASGIGSAFRKSATRGDLDFTGYAKWYQGLQRNRQAYTAVMANLPLSARKQLEALYRVSNGISESLNRRIATGRINAVRDELFASNDSLISNLYSAAKRSGVGLAAEAVTTPLGIPGAGFAAALSSALTKGKPNALAAVDELLASPEFAHLAQTTPGPERVQATKRLASSKAFANFVKAVGNPPSMKDRSAWIQGAMLPKPQPQNNDQRPQGATIH